MVRVLTVCLLLILLLSPLGFAQAVFYNLPGVFLYPLNSINQVADSNPTGTVAVALTNDPTQAHLALVTSFDPISGTELDSEIAGFGPSHIKAAGTAGGTRVAVLTNEGGPNAVSIYDLSSAGVLTLLGKESLTDSITDYSSNLALSGLARAGFVLVARSDNQLGNDLVAFSLDDAAELGRLAVGFSLSSLAINEVAGRRTLVFTRSIPDTSLVKVDATDPSHLVETGSVLLTNAGASTNPGIALSSDGRFAFLANGINGFFVVNLETMSVVDTLAGSFRERVEVFEGPAGRLLLLERFGENFGESSLLLVNASNPASLVEVNHLDFSTGRYGRAAFTFSRFGGRAVLATLAGFRILEVPSLNTIEEFPLPNVDDGVLHDVKLLGSSNRVLGVWGSFAALFGTVNVTEEALFNLCLQDDSTGNLLQINITTGDYQFNNCGGFAVGGTGSLTKKGNTYTLQHNASDRRVTAKIDTSAKRGSATVNVFSAGRIFSITDRNTTNNTCACD
jgi:hypothetical protein